MAKKFSFSRHVVFQKPKRSVRAVVLRDPKDLPPFFIRGMKAGSKDEYWVSLALERIEEQTGWTWRYQVPLFGGRSRRGGNVADFIVDTPGMKTLLDPMGRYWHTGAREDRKQMVEVARKKNMRLIAWFTDETPTKQMVYAFLRKEFHL